MSLVPRSPKVRGRTPLMTAPPSLEATYQEQIDDLVRQKQTLEFTNTKLAQEIRREAERGKEAAAAMEASWASEKSQWREGCDVLQSCHRVVQLRNTLDLCRERQKILDLQDALRIEKIRTSQRDYTIITFQAREGELEDRIADLEDERESLARGYDEDLRLLEAKHAKVIARIKSGEHDRATAEQERAELEAEVAQVNKKLADLTSKYDALEMKASRAQLRLESEQSKAGELEHAKEEATHTIADLRRQLEKWQSLENKGGTEVEKERKKRTTLEVQVTELKEQLEEAKEEHIKQIEKLKKKYEKMQDAYEELQAEAETHQQENEKAQKELSKAQKRIAKLEAAQESDATPALKEELEEKEKELSKAQRQLEKLRKELEEERSKVSTKATTMPDESDHEEDEEIVETPKPKAKATKPRSKRATTTENAVAGPSKQRKPRGKKQAEVESESEAEQLVKDLTKKGKGKAKAVAEEAEVEVEDQPVKKRGAKRKAADDQDSEVEIVAEATPVAPKAKAGGSRKKVAKGDQAEETDKGKSKQASKAPSDSQRTDENVEDDPPKKKKRKINMFPPINEGSAFNFGGLTDTGGLDIPTVLSPVKTTNIPYRSQAGSVVGSMSNMLRTSFAPGRR